MEVCACTRIVRLISVIRVLRGDDDHYLETTELQVHVGRREYVLSDEAVPPGKFIASVLWN